MEFGVFVTLILWVKNFWDGVNVKIGCVALSYAYVEKSDPEIVHV
jgi:hypothetical protein